MIPTGMYPSMRLRCISRIRMLPASPAPQTSTRRPVATSWPRGGRSMMLRTAKRAPPISSRLRMIEISSTPRGTDGECVGCQRLRIVITSSPPIATPRTIVWRSRRLVNRHHLV